VFLALVPGDEHSLPELEIGDAARSLDSSPSLFTFKIVGAVAEDENIGVGEVAAELGVVPRESPPSAQKTGASTDGVEKTFTDNPLLTAEDNRFK